MTDQPMAFACPNCEAGVPAGAPYCPRCGLKATGPEVGRLVSLRFEIRRLQSEWTDTMSRLRAVQQHEYDEYMRSQSASDERQQPTEHRPVFGASALADRSSAASAQRPVREWTEKRVQNLLLWVGAALCAVAALLFIVFAWSRLGLGGRAAIMTLTTAAFFGGGALTFGRNLKSTAESLTAVGFALTLIDIGAAYSLNFAGAQSVSQLTYWAIGLGVASLFAIAYRAALPILTTGIFAAVAIQIPAVLVLINEEASALAIAIVLGVQSVAIMRAGAALRSQQFLTDLLSGGSLLTWIGSTLVVWAGATANGNSDELVRDSIAVAMTGASAAAMAFIAPSTSSQIKRLWLAASTAAASILALTVGLRAFDGSSTVVFIAASGTVMTGVILATRRSFTEPLGVALLTAAGAALAAFGPVIAALGSGFFLPFNAWNVDASGIAHDATLADAEWTVEYWPAVVTVITALTAALVGVIPTARRTASGLAATLGATAAFVALLVADVPYSFFVALITLVALTLVFGAHAITNSRLWKHISFGTGVAFAAEALVWSMGNDVATVSVIGVFTAAAFGYAFVSPRRATVAGTIGAGGLLSWVLAATLWQDQPVAQCGFLVVLAASAIAVTADRTRKIDPETILGVTGVFSVIGLSMSVFDHGWASWTLLALFVGLGALSTSPDRRGLVPAAQLALFAYVGVLTNLHDGSYALSGFMVVATAAIVAIPADSLLPRRAANVLTASAFGAFLGILSAADDEQWLALSFLVASAATGIVAMAPHRRSLGWVASALSIASLWTRLVDVDISTIEAYTVPVAAVMLFAGWRTMRAHADTPSWTAYGAGLGTAFGPSLMMMVTSDNALRALLLAAAALLTLALGSAYRYKALLVIGASTLLVEAVLQFGEYVYYVPRWVGVGVIGGTLLVVGATYERRLRDARKLRAAYDALQ